MYTVYKHTTPSNKVYIGITKRTTQARWANGLGYQSSPHFWSAIQKYGWDNIKHEVLHEGLTKEQACEYEKRYIEEYNATDRRFGYNQKTGGEIGVIFNEEVCKKISESQKDFYRLHPEKREAIAKRVTGFRHSEDTKKKMSIAKTGTHFTMTEEWKKKIGEANKQRLLDDEALYQATSQRCRENGKKVARKVEQIDANGSVVAIYESMKAAGRATGIKDGNISSVCRGLAKSAGGYRWRYAI